MFVVCGGFDNKIRVWDTTDNTVEFIESYEQLKLVQAMGYRVVFDKTKDYIYNLYFCEYLTNHDAFSALKNVTGNVLDDINVLEMELGHYGGGFSAVVYLIFSKEKIVLFSIYRSETRFKLYTNDGIKGLIPFPIDSIWLDYNKTGGYSITDYIRLRYLNNGVSYTMVFDLYGNYIKTIEV